MVLIMVLYLDKKVEPKTSVGFFVRMPCSVCILTVVRVLAGLSASVIAKRWARYFWTVSSLLVRSQWLRVRSCWCARQRCSWVLGFFGKTQSDDWFVFGALVPAGASGAGCVTEPVQPVVGLVWSPVLASPICFW